MKHQLLGISIATLLIGGQAFATDWSVPRTPDMDDPAVFTTSGTAEVPMRARPAGDKMYEYACHEGNYALPGILAGARVQELDQ